MEIVKRTKDGRTIWFGPFGAVYSEWPPRDDFYYQRMLPPNPVENVLILGVCGNTIGRLIKEKYPNCRVTLLDKNPIPEVPVDIVMDAKEYIEQTADKYDFIVIDLYDENGIAPFVVTDEFARKLAEMAPLVAMNAMHYSYAQPYWPYFDVIAQDVAINNLVIMLKRKNG